MDPRVLPPHLRRQNRKPRDSIMGITRPTIRSLTATYISRLARRGGVIRMKQEIYDEVRTVVRSRLEVVLKQVVLILDSSTTHKRNRKVVTSRDVSPYHAPPRKYRYGSK
ncbi:hypothetical protein EYZ11_002646 [Aspergillus tanneri]|uniref:Histone H4 n=1 Tax=Aspergillus tanneri TaxID=1220188 RepID=A0A4S3JQJ8_9EURO|nr:hypothetical protein EYZ11_002646 [Aspergillus tanneri]